MQKEPLANHPMRQDALNQIIAGVPDCRIAKQLGVHPSTILRFRRRNQQAIRNAVDPASEIANTLKQQGLLAESDDPAILQAATSRIAQSLASASGLVARIEEHQAALCQAVKSASSKRDYRGISNLLSVDCKRIELLGKLTGVLREGGPGAGSLNIVVMMPEQQGRDMDGGPILQATCEPG